MNLMEKIRNTAFWIVDALKGKPIKKHMDEINSIMWEKDENVILEYTNKRLQKLLSHSKNTTQFYCKIDVSKGIAALPVVDKNCIRNNYDAFFSNKFDKSSCFSAATSGSTGTPFKAYHDKEKKNRNTADTIFLGKLSGFEVGMKLYYLRTWNEFNRKSPLKAWMENIEQVDVMSLSESEFPAFIEKLKNEKRPFAIIGYASSFDSLCRYLGRHDPLLKIGGCVSIIGIAEAISDYAKEGIFKHFGIQPISRYSNSENGIIAQQGKNEKSFLINRASYFVEILEMDSDKQVAQGKSGRIVVTDLLNFAMPMIRYDTGDIGSLGLNSQNQVVIENVEGRKVDMVYDTAGQFVSPFFINYKMWFFIDEIKQYQFVQIDEKSYILNLNVGNIFRKEKELISEFESILGLDAQIDINYVHEIPLLSSGKRKNIVNKMK